MGMTRDEYQTIIDNTNQASVNVAMQRDITIADCFEGLTEQHPDKYFLIFEDHHFSYADINNSANNYAKVLLKAGVTKGDSVALMMENRVEFFYAWLGILKIGAVAALINTEAKTKAVSHAVTTVDSRFAFVGIECYPRYATGDERLFKIPVVVVDDAFARSDVMAALPATVLSDDAALADAASQSFDKSVRGDLNNTDNACYIFTSGTTGLPKAAYITHFKWLSTGHRWLAMAPINEDDIFYCTIPIFHGAGLMSLFSAVLAVGSHGILRRKFSARNFWKDIAKYKITVAIYVGELCRYMLQTPVCDEEKNHTLRIMLGSGMGVDIWEDFQARFGEHILIREGWGATESNCNMSNFDNRPGSCGRVPYWEKTFMRLVAYDVENDCHVLDDNGFCTLAGVNNPGELLGQVNTGSGQVVSPFDGYTDAEATEKKLLRNVFEKGDCWFRSGDLFREDDEGYFYFVDRIGDTFRWKSENVSTTEVAHQLADYADAEMINIYGVKVPNAEGRAGMAAVVMQQGKTFDGAHFYSIAKNNLQPYAMPLFVRVVSAADLTGTYKLRKVDLLREAYNPARFGDPLFVLDNNSATYTPYSEQALANLGVAASD